MRRPDDVLGKDLPELFINNLLHSIFELRPGLTNWHKRCRWFFGRCRIVSLKILFNKKHFVKPAESRHIRVLLGLQNRNNIYKVVTALEIVCYTLFYHSSSI